MNGFRIGFIAALSFLITMSVSAYTAAYVPPPTGPKAPEYPSYSTLGTQFQAQQNPISALLPKPSPIRQLVHKIFRHNNITKHI